MRREKLPDMFKRFERMMNEFPDLEENFRDLNLNTVPVDVKETEDQVIAKADMPGIDKDSIRVKIRGETLAISGEGRKEVKEEGKDYIRKERSRKSFSRKVDLGVPVDRDSAEAEYRDGVLTVKVDKKEKEKGVEIEVE
ncbi:MAG: Hsp20/alpha crystallin family protein [Candidatus Nanohaloarchaeota archaeon QJJ-9]|nr:Hsp20/alpha crystallin family protein [Candidatus Nanohaloarchaeota archaeon QJJ-9]